MVGARLPSRHPLASTPGAADEPSAGAGAVLAIEVPRARALDFAARKACRARTGCPWYRSRGHAMNASRRAVLLAMLALGLGGCPDAPSDPDVARRVIGPGGGIITSTDDVLTLAIPPGALEEAVELFVLRSDEPPAVFGEAYLVRPSPVLRYDISVTYRQELPDDTSALAVGAIDATAYEEGRGRWEPLPLLRVDRQAKLVSGLDDGVSIFYGLLNDAEPSVSDDDGETTGTGDPTTGTDPDTDTGDPTTGAPDDTGPGEGTDGTDGTSGTSGTGEAAPSFARDVQPILQASCDCHVDAAPAQLSFTDAYAGLVDVPSTEAPGLDRVEPGAPDDSYLWHKLSGTHIAAGGSGDPMPAPAGGLDAGSLATIEAWISGGAEP